MFSQLFSSVTPIAVQGALIVTASVSVLSGIICALSGFAVAAAIFKLVAMVSIISYNIIALSRI